MADKTIKELMDIIRKLESKGNRSMEQKRQLHQAKQKLRHLKLLKNGRIKISISCGRSTDYADEYWIEDMDGNVIAPSDFPPEWNGIEFKAVAKNKRGGNQPNG